MTAIPSPISFSIPSSNTHLTHGQKGPLPKRSFWSRNFLAKAKSKYQAEVSGDLSLAPQPVPLFAVALAVPSVPRDVVAPRHRCAACGDAALGTDAGVNAQRLLAPTQCRQKAWEPFALPHHNTGAAITLPHIRPRLRRCSACSSCCDSRCASSSRCWSRSCTVDSCTLSHSR